MNADEAKLLNLAATMGADRNLWKSKIIQISDKLGYPGDDCAETYGDRVTYSLAAIDGLYEHIDSQNQTILDVMMERDEARQDVEDISERSLDWNHSYVEERNRSHYAHEDAERCIKALRDALAHVTKQRDQAQDLIKSYVNSNTKRVRGDFQRSLIEQGLTIDNWKCGVCGTDNGWTSIWCGFCGRNKNFEGVYVIQDGDGGHGQ